jgi:LysR family glycine cleavage system transcriptional activator
MKRYNTQFPSLASLRAIEALDRLGTASAVAHELGMTQSAVSRQLQQFELQYNAPLVRREKQRLYLTPKAVEFAHGIRRALDDIQQATLLFQMEQPTAGSLTLGILPAFGMRWLMPRLVDFSEGNPDVTINMLTRLVPFDFATDPADAALHYGRPSWPGTKSLLLQREKLVVVCHPDLAPNGEISLPELSQMPLLHIASRPDAWSNWFKKQGWLDPIKTRGIVYDQFSTISHACGQGLGVALMPEFTVEHDIASGRVVQPIMGDGQTDEAYYLVWPDNAPMSRPLNVFHDWLKTVATDA